MSSFYTVVQYVPDPIADERINIGVIAFSGATVFAHFLAEWRRVKNFGGEDVEFLKDFSRRLQRVLSRQRDGVPVAGGQVDADNLRRLIGSWHNSIQFTPARASLSEPQALLREAIQRFLSEPVRAAEEAGPRDHQYARSIAVSRVRRAVHALVGDMAELLTRRRFPLEGEKSQHTFAVAVANGVPYLAAQAVSLERAASTQLITALDAIAWSVADTHAQHAALPIGVLMLAPRSTSPAFANLDRVYRERASLYTALGAEVLQEDQVEDWARSVLTDVLPR
jgi:hypothetical protein